MPRFIFIVFILILPLLSWGQIEIKGKVFEKGTDETLIGASILEVGTQNGTVSDIDGNFSLRVQDENAILQISYTDYQIQEIKINQTRRFEIHLKSSCTKCWFDSQHIGLFLNPGFIGHPIGGALLISSPSIPGGSTLESKTTYQTNKNKGYLFSSSLRLLHFVSSCSFDADFSIAYIKLKSKEQLDFDNYTIEANLNWRRFRPIIGISKIEYNKQQEEFNLSKTGPVLGLQTRIGHPFSIGLSGKVSIYDGLTGYQAEANWGYRSLQTFLRYEKVGDFSELSLGVGYMITYLFKRQSEFIKKQKE